MLVTPHHTAEQLAGLIRGESRGKTARRLTAARLPLPGHAAAGVHALLVWAGAGCHSASKAQGARRT